MTQNAHNAVIHLGHQNGTVTLWTPNLPHPAVRLLAHLGPVVGVSVDASTGGRYMATSGQDGTVKVWDCRNWKGAVRSWQTRGGGADVEWSQKGVLAVASGGSVNVCSPILYLLFSTLTLTHTDEPLDIRQTGHPNYFHRHSASTAVPHSSYTSPPTYCAPILSFPGYPHSRTLCRAVKYTRPRIWRAKLRQFRS